MGTGCGDAATQFCLAFWSSPALITHTQGSLAMAMVTGAVVLGRNTARTSVRAEAGGSVFLTLALLSRLAHVGSAQGNLTKLTWETLAVEGSRLVSAAPPIGTGGAATLVHVFLTSGAGESRKAEALEAVEQVMAGSLVQAGVRGALIDLHLTEPPFQAWWAEAVEGCKQVQAGAAWVAGL